MGCSRDTWVIQAMEHVGQGLASFMMHRTHFEVHRTNRRGALADYKMHRTSFR
jgi:hypothetical protein